MREAEARIGENLGGGLVGRQRFVSTTEVQENAAPVVQDLAQAFARIEGAVPLFGDGVGAECFAVAAHAFVAQTAVLMYERSQHLRLLLRGPHSQVAYAIQRVQDDLSGIECFLISS